MIVSLAGLPGKMKLLLDRITVARANGLDNITAGPVALAATALSTAVWTGSKAGFIDVAISSVVTHNKYIEYTATGAFTFTWPAGVDIVCVTLIGGGASGAGGVTNSQGGGGGGAGETVYRNYITRQGATTTTGSIGAGGAAAAATAAGTAGTASTFGTIVALAGGNPGAGSGRKWGGDGGGWKHGNQPSTDSTIGTDGANYGIHITGACGGNASSTSGNAVGKGGQCVTTWAGGSTGGTGNFSGGGGGSSYRGIGGTGGVGATPAAGSAPAVANTGAGGGGGSASAAAQAGSGAGAAGYCIIEYIG